MNEIVLYKWFHRRYQKSIDKISRIAYLSLACEVLLIIFLIILIRIKIFISTRSSQRNFSINNKKKAIIFPSFDSI